MNNFLVRLTAPFAIWFAHFSAVYGAHAALCSAGHSGSMHRTSIILATAIAVAAIAAVFAIPLRSREQASDRMAVTFATSLAVLAVMWTSLSALLLEACV